ADAAGQVFGRAAGVRYREVEGELRRPLRMPEKTRFGDIWEDALKALRREREQAFVARFPGHRRIVEEVSLLYGVQRLPPGVGAEECRQRCRLALVDPLLVDSGLPKEPAQADE